MMTLMEQANVTLTYWTKRYGECEKRFLAIQESYHRADDLDVIQELANLLLDAEIEYNEASEELKKSRLDYLVCDENRTPTPLVFSQRKDGKLMN